MDGLVCESLSLTPADGHLKRRRGRPRKDGGFTGGAYSHVPCKKELASKTLPQVETRPTAQHLSVGQPIGGIIEAVFDAGYLLKVKLSSGTTLQGVIFKPGHYEPFSSENDVAPNAHLIRRNEVSFPSGSQIMCYDKRRRGRQSHRNVYGYPHTFNGAHVDHLPCIAANPISTRCKFVPMVLSYPFCPPNGIPPRSSAPHMVSSISKQLSPFSLESLHLVNGALPSHLKQNLPFLHQSNVSIAAAASPGNLSAIPFQQLIDEVIRRTQSPPPTRTHVRKEVSDLEEPLSAEPLQAIQPNYDGILHDFHRKTENNKWAGEAINLYQESVANRKMPRQNGKRSSFQNYEGRGTCKGSDKSYQDGV